MQNMQFAMAIACSIREVNRVAAWRALPRLH